METRKQLVVGLLLAMAATFVAIAGAQAQSDVYNNNTTDRYQDARQGNVGFYRQGSPTRSNTGGGRYSTSVYGRSDSSRPSYANGGLTGSARYTGAGSFYNEQGMNYFSASSQGPRLQVREVSHPSRRSDYTQHWAPKREDGYYKKYWREQ